jgi:hypothetical protein
MTELASPKTRSSSDPLARWALRQIRLDGRPFSFQGHEYLRAIYDDKARHVVVSKAAQVGGTTWAILRSLHACLNGLNVIYFFPTRTDVLEFSKSRVGPLLAENPFLQRQLTDTDTAGLKRIGDAHLYLRGMQSTVGMKSVPADMLVFDELDEATPEAKTLARERIAHSDYKRIIELSNPSLPDYGVDEQYQASDQKHWHLKCSSCNAWTSLEKEFPRKLGEEVRIILPREDGSYYRACPKCQAELDPDQGEWLADFPGRDIHGYRISQLFSARVDPGEVLHEYRTTRFADRFYNLKIGVPWADLERRLDVMSVLALCTDEPMPEESDKPSYMGVDTGRQLHVVIVQAVRTFGEEPHRLVHLGIYHDFADLQGLMKRFRVQACFFNEHQRGSANWDGVSRTVSVNRTEALDASREAIRKQKLCLPRRTPMVEEFARHMSADAKILDENPETGALQYRYVRTGTNHYSMAFTYAWMAIERHHFAGSLVSVASGPS